MVASLIQLSPATAKREVDGEETVRNLCEFRLRQRLLPFSEPLSDFIAAFSAALAAAPLSRQHPELQALAFGLRPAALQRLRERFNAAVPAQCVAVPRGLAFHIAPSNVDTVALHSMALSLLCGNATLVRVSTRPSPQMALIVDTLNEVAHRETSHVVRDLFRIVRYEHDSQLTECFSANCDVRVIWGGDATITQIRAAKLGVFARELVFGDRAAYCVIDANAFLALDDQARHALVGRFWADTYVFNQLACSSPRMLFWLGDEQRVQQASQLLFGQLAGTLQRKGYQLEPHTMLDKVAYCFGALAELQTGTLRRYSSELMVIGLDVPALPSAPFCGGGVFFEVRLRRLEELVPFVSRKDQTLTHFGVDVQELRELALSLAGRGIDRMVPVGNALEFSHLWDGVDLLRELIRLVHVS